MKYLEDALNYAKSVSKNDTYQQYLSSAYQKGFENAIKLVLENVTTDCQWCSGYGNCTVDEDSILNLLK